MHRLAEQDLRQWKDDPFRLPLIVRGARQVGKTFLIESIAKQLFENSITINFEVQPQFHQCFAGELIPQTIIKQIEILSNQQCNPGKTLLFLDEIQECPRAILSLRYFKEQLPNLHVIAAGSLLEFTLADTSFSFPVGRVSFLHLKPLSFIEFLYSLDKKQLISFLSEVKLSDTNPIPPVIHDMLLDLIRHYVVLGGMPAVVHRYAETQSLLKANEAQRALMQSYMNDFGKYATRAQQPALQQLLQAAPAQVGKQFKYSSVHPDMRAREVKTALEQLQWAQVLSLVHATPASGLPLFFNAKPNKFKILFLDVGLMNHNFNVTDLIISRDKSLLHWGTLMEQMVGQELLAYQPRNMPGELFYWVRDKKGSMAELDYLTTINNQIIPIEVKAGKTGRLKSLAQFLETSQAPIGIQISEAPLALNGKILSIPFYLIHELERLILEVTN